MDETKIPNLYRDRLDEISEQYLDLARAIERAVRPSGSGRPVDRLRRLLEVCESPLADPMRPFASDAVAAAAACHLRLIARAMTLAGSAGFEGEPDRVRRISGVLVNASSEMLDSIIAAERALDPPSDPD